MNRFTARTNTVTATLLIGLLAGCGADDAASGPVASSNKDDAGADVGVDAGSVADAPATKDAATPEDAGPPDTGTPDTGTPDTGTPDTGTPDTGGCTPVAEVCNGLDDDCDTVPDNGLDCGTCPDAFNMALIVRPDRTAFCVDRYESSRQDATSTTAGVDGSLAVSQLGVLPWGNVGLTDARNACTAAGKRLCTGDEWFEGCGGITDQAYPYDPATYNADACNGLDAGMGLPGATGSRLLCESTDGTFDQSGNLAEWVEGGFVRGGSYGASQTQLRCDDPGIEPDLVAPGDVVGFRCCADSL